MVLEKITSPADMKGLSRGDLQTLVNESRQALLQKVSAHGRA